MLRKILKQLLDSEERRLTYEDGFPIVWDSIPSGEKVLEVINAINILKNRKVINALKRGLNLPEAEVFFWISPDGEIDYGVVQGDYFITLWVPSARKLKTVEEARERIFSLAKNKLKKERKYYEEVIKDLLSPWFYSEKEKEFVLKMTEKNLHPSWKDLHKKLQKLKKEHPTCPWCGKRHPAGEHYQCAPDYHLEAAYEERFEME